jgi:hypothetical protein
MLAKNAIRMFIITIQSNQKLMFASNRELMINADNAFNQNFTNEVNVRLRNNFIIQRKNYSTTQNSIENFKNNFKSLTFVRIFTVCSQTTINFHKFFRKFDIYVVLQKSSTHAFVRINIVYKRKAQKIKFVNANDSNEFTSNDQIK